MRPMVLTIEWQQEPGCNCITGVPIATTIRPMTMLGHLVYKLKRLLKRDRVIQIPHGGRLGINASAQVYLVLSGKNTHLSDNTNLTFLPPPYITPVRNTEVKI